MLGRVVSFAFVALSLLSRVALGDNPVNAGFPYGSQKGRVHPSALGVAADLVYSSWGQLGRLAGARGACIRLRVLFDVDVITAVDHSQSVRQHWQPQHC